MMKKIKNLHDLRYRKLYLRSEIKIKESKIKQHLAELRTDVQTADFKSEIIQSAMNNPAMFVNTARISYEIVKFFRRRRKRRNQKNKAS